MLLIELIILQASVRLQIIINLSLSAISCGLFELLSQLTGKLCCFQSALSFYAEVFAIRSDDTVWFGHRTHFSQSHPHSCRKLYHVRHLEDQSSHLHNKSSNSIAITMLCIFSTIQSSMGKAMAPHSSTPAWKIPLMEEPGGLQSMGSLRVRHDRATSLSRTGEGNGNPLQCSCLENPRDGEPGGLPSMGSHRVGHNWSDSAAAAMVISNNCEHTHIQRLPSTSTWCILFMEAGQGPCER